MPVKAIPTIPLDATSAAPISAPTRPSLANEITVDALYCMTAQNERAVIRGVDWADYERLLEVVGERSAIRLAYDGKDLEIMSPGPLHDDVKGRAGKFVEIVSEELDVAWRNLGSTTWKRPAIERGIEADQSYYFQPDKLALAALAVKRKSNNVADYPNPDLAIEVDISPYEVDRPGIYAALRVTEVWRFDAHGITIERLNDDGTFAAVETSGFLPVRADEIARWVLEEDTSDIRDWMRRLRTWVRAEVVGRLR
jgi:Uma2 family endonuclease